MISYIHHICEFRQYCYVGNTAQQFRLGLFQDSDFPGDPGETLKTQNQHQVDSYAFSDVKHLCQ